MQTTPFLTEYDSPDSESKGSLDPLGLYSIADLLAEKLVPGVRERQSHPRFLTAIAVSALVCSKFDDNTVAKDKISEPWQVFEWYMVEGLVRRLDGSELRGVPGREKAIAAIKDNVPLSANRYLKTPVVFGFHGVYRVLARNLGILNINGDLEDNGYELVKTWANENGIPGFVNSEEGEGSVYRDQLYSAIKKSLDQGSTAMSNGWSGWDFFQHFLHPSKINKNEAQRILNVLLDTQAGFRKNVIEFLISNKGQQILRNSNGDENESSNERKFHLGLKDEASVELKKLIETIIEYEKFSRLLQDYFDDCRFFLSGKTGKTNIKDLVSISSSKNTYKDVTEIFPKVNDLLLNYKIDFSRFQSLGEQSNLLDWVTALVEHHIRVQREKPPSGKSPWLIKDDLNNIAIYPDYRVDKGGLHDESYLHFYRTRALWSFLIDLKVIKDE